MKIGSLVAAGSALALSGAVAAACSTPPTIKVSSNPPSSGSGSGGAGSGGSAGGCSVSWEGGNRSFGAPKALSSDAASTVLGTFFPPSGPPQVLISEPTVPDLVLRPADASAAAQRLDSSALAVPLGAELAISEATDSTGLAISYGTAADYVSSDGTVHGPFSLANAGLLSITALVALEQGGGAALLGLSQTGPVWTTLGPSGFGPLTTFSFGETPDATQPLPILWDDGTGSLSAILPLGYGAGASLGLFAVRGGGAPFAFGAPIRLDVAAPGQVSGFEAALGPTGALGVLFAEGPSGQPGELAGFTLDSSGTLSGGVIASLPGALALQQPAAGSTPWDSGCGFGGSCDPVVRFAGSGDLVAAWTLEGQLNFARLPAGSSGWQAPQQVVGGPLLSPLATDAAGDLAGLSQAPAGDAIAIAPAGGAPSFEALPQITGLAPGPFVAATAAGGGALWAMEPVEPGEIFGWTFSMTGGTPVAAPAVALPGGEQLTGLGAAAATAPSSVGSSFFGTASAGWLLLGGGLDGSADLLLAAYDPATAIVAAPVSVAVAGWQQSTGVTAPTLYVDSRGTALVAFSQVVGTDTAANLYLASASAGGKPAVACAPLAPIASGPALSLFVDQIPYGPAALTGSGRLVVSYDAPATAALAQ